jgi:hypothetical protein
MSEAQESFRLTLTKLPGSHPPEAAFFLHDKDDAHFHSGKLLFSDIRTGFKAGLGMSDESLAKLEARLNSQREDEQWLRNVTRSGLRTAGLLPPETDAPKVDIEVHAARPR